MSLTYPYPLPLYRYIAWSNLPAGIQSVAASSLNFTEDSWNVPLTNEDIEHLAYDSLDPDQKAAAFQLAFTNDTWDCWVNHYVGYSWKNLLRLEVAPLWSALGWDRMSWNGFTGPPPSNSQYWANLTSEEQAAAAKLCFFESTWNSVALNDSAFEVPDIGVQTLPTETWAPTGAPTQGEPAPWNISLRYPYPLPLYRYTKWLNLREGLQSMASGSLKYTLESWNNPSSNEAIEHLAYYYLDPDQKAAANQLAFNEDTWDCWVNHYVGYRWKFLVQFELAPHFEALGWDRSSYNGQTDPPPSDSKYWVNLTAKEQTAAAQLCYFQSTWDLVGLDDSAFQVPADIPVQVETPPPTEAPTVTASPTVTTTASPTSTPSVSPAPTAFSLYLHELPMHRFTPWGDLPEEIMLLAKEGLGYNELTWNRPSLVGPPTSNNLEQRAFADLRRKQRQAAIEIGFTKDTWDCWVNHFTAYGWVGLESRGISPHLKKLGWNNTSWRGETDPPTDDALKWDELSDEQQRAAAAICYFRDLWDEVELSENFRLPDIEATVPETGVETGPTVPATSPPVSQTPETSPETGPPSAQGTSAPVSLSTGATSSSSDGLSSGAIVGISIAAVALAVLVLMTAIFMRRKRHPKVESNERVYHNEEELDGIYQNEEEVNNSRPFS